MNKRRTLYFLISFLLSDCICFLERRRSKELALKDVLYGANIENPTETEKKLAKRIVDLEFLESQLLRSNVELSYKTQKAQKKLNRINLPIMARIVIETAETQLDFESIKLCHACGGREHGEKPCNKLKKHPAPSNPEEIEMTVYRRAARWVWGVNESTDSIMKMVKDDLIKLYNDIEGDKPHSELLSKFVDSDKSHPKLLSDFVEYVKGMEDFDEFLWAFCYTVANMYDFVDVQVQSEIPNDRHRTRKLRPLDVYGYKTYYFLQILIKDVGNYIDPSKPSKVYQIPNKLPPVLDSHELYYKSQMYVQVRVC